MTVKDVEDVLKRQNVEISGGRIESSMRKFNVLSETDLHTPDQFNALIIRQQNGYPIRLSDVMLENIHRRIEDSMNPMEADFSGSREIAFAVVAMTLTLAAVFAPLAFMSGNTGRLFSEFALAVSCTVLVSGFVALTLTPMMCSRLLQAKAQGCLAVELAPTSIGGGWDSFVGYYRAMLLACLRWRWLVVLSLTLVAGAAWWLFQSLPSELSPVEDRDAIFAVVSAPEGATIDYTDAYAHQIESFLAPVPEIETYFVVVDPGLEPPNPAIAFVSP